MSDLPHKIGKDALAELSSLSIDTRRHILGLFERHTEALIILALQCFGILGVVAVFPHLVLKLKGVLQIIWLSYIGFSIFWLVRPAYAIRKEIIQSLTEEELREGNTYSRYCEGGWFYKTLGVLFIATAVLAVALGFALTAFDG
jgi:hypothetical protein